LHVSHSELGIVCEAQTPHTHTRTRMIMPDIERENESKILYIFSMEYLPFVSLLYEEKNKKKNRRFD
jgi:hypothetical protein